MKRLLILSLLLLSFAAAPALAGQTAKVFCSKPGCGYKTDLAIGGAMKYPTITGYCAKCRDFVAIQLASWADYRGKTYNCPKGHGPFTPIYEISDISKFPCPKCGQRTLTAEPGMMFD